MFDVELEVQVMRHIVSFVIKSQTQFSDFQKTFETDPAVICKAFSIARQVLRIDPDMLWGDGK